MKRSLFSILFIFYFSNLLFAQNWECIKVNGQYLFSRYSPKGASESISIDSVYEVSSRVYLQNHKSLRSYDGGCYLPDQPSFIGSKIWIDSSGAYNFLTLSEQAIILYPGVDTGDTWVMYKNSGDNLVFECTVESKELASVLTLQDSVKTYILQAKDTLGNIKQHCFNGKRIKLSKNYGLIEIPDFYLFPSCQMPIETYKIVGIPVPLTGVQNIGFEEIYNMEIGDEFHTYYHWEGPPGYESSSQAISKLTGKTVNANATITFIFHQFLLSNGTLYDSAIITQEVNFNSFTANQLKKVPGETLLRNPNGLVIALSSVGTYNDDGPLAKYNGVPVYSFSSAGCFRNNDPGIVSQYIMGCGGPYDSYGEYHNHWGTKLVYYKKGETEWGTPYVINDTLNMGEEKRMFADVLVYPNPATQLIKLKIMSRIFHPLILEIHDILGNEITRISINSPEVEIDVSNFKNGVYLYKLYNSATIHLGKIIKR